MVTSMGRSWFLLALVGALGLCPIAGAQSQDVVLEADIGWGGRFRPDRWSPALVRAQAARPTPVVLKWYVPRPGREAMVIEQHVVLNPGPATHIAYLPIGPDPAAVHLTVSDARTGRTLAYWPTSVISPIQYADAQVRQPIFVGVSGAGPALRFLDDRDFGVSYLATEDLPRRAIGYDGLDVLALNRPQLATMELEQQEAIAAWVRAGGRLLMWLDVQPLPDHSPLMSLLPGGGVAGFTQRELDGQGVFYAQLRDADEQQLVTRAPVGEGEVIFLHVPPELALRLGANFMPQAPLRETIVAPALAPAALAAAKEAASTSSAGSLLVMLMIALLIGPVDWLVLRRSRRRMRRWLTLPGWLAIFGLLLWFLPSREAPQTWVALSPGDSQAPVARATVATTGSRLLPSESEELAKLHAIGRPYWRTLGFNRTTGPMRDLAFVQGEDGMAASAGGQPAALMADGFVLER